MEKTLTPTILHINKLNESIRKLKYFISAVDPGKNIQRGSGSYDIRSIIKVKAEKSYSIFCSRWYGCGTHESEIPVPNELIDELQSLAIERLRTLESELSSLLPKSI